MALKALLAAIKRPAAWFMEKRPVLDTTPVEVSPDLRGPISSLADLRRMMETISRENAEKGNESFEEFYDFGEDDEFEDIPAPAQMKHDAVMLARDRDFEGEVVKAKEDYKERINKEARATILSELKKKQEKEAAEEEG